MSIPAMPQDVRTHVNVTLTDRDMTALDDNARFIVRRLVAEAYAKGFESGWFAGQDDARTDSSIRFDAERRKETTA